MKNVKVFIASSAELDEDKLQMDLYFSQKNKGYRKRAICFEQRTWRDFPSYLSEEHLQNRYDDYIRQCDIVIFLFHTRLGQYTLRELQVAFEQVKASGGKRPKIYIYAKRDEHGAALLEKLKQYSEQEYGHFCDTYADYNELFHHFDYQLTQLENEGFIRPNPVDLPRTRRFVLLCFCLMFSFSGMAFVDFAHLRKENVKDGVLSYHRQKSGSFIRVEIPADVRLLLDELAVCTDKDSPYLFPFLSGKKTGEAAYAEYNGALLRFNRDLRSLAETCGVGEPVTSYTIRHSFATTLKEQDVPIEMISELLGHQSIKTTQIYLKSFSLDRMSAVNKACFESIYNEVSKVG